MESLKQRFCIFCRNDIAVGKFGSMKDAISFKSWGEYGNDLFGNLDGSRLELCICNTCMKARKEDFIYYGPLMERKPKSWEPDGEQ